MSRWDGGCSDKFLHLIKDVYTEIYTECTEVHIIAGIAPTILAEIYTKCNVWTVGHSHGLCLLESEATRYSSWNVLLQIQPA